MPCGIPGQLLLGVVVLVSVQFDDQAGVAKEEVDTVAVMSGGIPEPVLRFQHMSEFVRLLDELVLHPGIRDAGPTIPAANRALLADLGVA